MADRQSCDSDGVFIHNDDVAVQLLASGFLQYPV